MSADRTPLLGNDANEHHHYSTKSQKNASRSSRPQRKTPDPEIQDENDEDYYYEEEPWPATTKYSLMGVGVALAVGCIYLFAFYLPSLFIPEARNIEDLIKVDSLDATLVPISSGHAARLGMDPELSLLELQHLDQLIDASELQHLDQLTDEGTSSREEATKRRQVERFILVGDIHGHYTHFKNLLHKVNFNPQTDHLLVLGDFITKGPDSFKVLDYLIEHDIDCILGNHEYYVLNNYARFHGLPSPKFTNETDTTYNGGLSTSGFNDDPEYLLAKKLQPHHVKYINSCSVIKTLGPVPVHKISKNDKFATDGTKKYAEGLAVHAGIRWDKVDNLEDQAGLECLEMRSLIGPFFNESTGDPSLPRAVSWSKIWNQKQKQLPLDDTHVVYYGHDARRGVNLKRFAKGLDSGCDRGDRLTAMIIWKQRSLDAKGREVEVYREQLQDVSC